MAIAKKINTGLVSSSVKEPKPQKLTTDTLYKYLQMMGGEPVIVKPDGGQATKGKFAFGQDVGLNNEFTKLPEIHVRFDDPKISSLVAKELATGELTVGMQRNPQTGEVETTTKKFEPIPSRGNTQLRGYRLGNDPTGDYLAFNKPEEAYKAPKSLKELQADIRKSYQTFGLKPDATIADLEAAVMPIMTEAKNSPELRDRLQTVLTDMQSRQVLEPVATPEPVRSPVAPAPVSVPEQTLDTPSDAWKFPQQNERKLPNFYPQMASGDNPLGTGATVQSTYDRAKSAYEGYQGFGYAPSDRKFPTFREMVKLAESEGVKGDEAIKAYIKGKQNAPLIDAGVITPPELPLTARLGQEYISPKSGKVGTVESVGKKGVKLNVDGQVVPLEYQTLEKLKYTGNKGYGFSTPAALRPILGGFASGTLGAIAFKQLAKAAGLNEDQQNIAAGVGGVTGALTGGSLSLFKPNTELKVPTAQQFARNVMGIPAPSESGMFLSAEGRNKMRLNQLNQYDVKPVLGEAAVIATDLLTPHPYGIATVPAARMATDSWKSNYDAIAERGLAAMKTSATGATSAIKDFTYQTLSQLGRSAGLPFPMTEQSVGQVLDAIPNAQQVMSMADRAKARLSRRASSESGMVMMGDRPSISPKPFDMSAIDKGLADWQNKLPDKGAAIADEIDLKVSQTVNDKVSALGLFDPNSAEFKRSYPYDASSLQSKRKAIMTAAYDYLPDDAYNSFYDAVEKQEADLWRNKYLEGVNADYRVPVTPVEFSPSKLAPAKSSELIKFEERLTKKGVSFSEELARDYGIYGNEFRNLTEDYQETVSTRDKYNQSVERISKPTISPEMPLSTAKVKQGFEYGQKFVSPKSGEVASLVTGNSGVTTLETLKGDRITLTPEQYQKLNPKSPAALTDLKRGDGLIANKSDLRYTVMETTPDAVKLRGEDGVIKTARKSQVLDLFKPNPLGITSNKAVDLPMRLAKGFAIREGSRFLAKQLGANEDQQNAIADAVTVAQVSGAVYQNVTRSNQLSPNQQAQAIDFNRKYDSGEIAKQSFSNKRAPIQKLSFEESAANMGMSPDEYRKFQEDAYKTFPQKTESPSGSGKPPKYVEPSRFAVDAKTGDRFDMQSFREANTNWRRSTDEATKPLREAYDQAIKSGDKELQKAAIEAMDEVKASLPPAPVKSDFLAPLDKPVKSGDRKMFNMGAMTESAIESRRASRVQSDAPMTSYQRKFGILDEATGQIVKPKSGFQQLVDSVTDSLFQPKKSSGGFGKSQPKQSNFIAESAVESAAKSTGATTQQVKAAIASQRASGIAPDLNKATEAISAQQSKQLSTRTQPSQSKALSTRVLSRQQSDGMIATPSQSMINAGLKEQNRIKIGDRLGASGLGIFMDTAQAAQVLTESASRGENTQTALTRAGASAGAGYVTTGLASFIPNPYLRTAAQIGGGIAAVVGADKAIDQVVGRNEAKEQKFAKDLSKLDLQPTNEKEQWKPFANDSNIAAAYANSFTAQIQQNLDYRPAARSLANLTNSQAIANARLASERDTSIKAGMDAKSNKSIAYEDRGNGVTVAYGRDRGYTSTESRVLALQNLANESGYEVPRTGKFESKTLDALEKLGYSQSQISEYIQGKTKAIGKPRQIEKAGSAVRQVLNRNTEKVTGQQLSQALAAERKAQGLKGGEMLSQGQVDQVFSSLAGRSLTQLRQSAKVGGSKTQSAIRLGAGIR